MGKEPGRGLSAAPDPDRRAGAAAAAAEVGPASAVAEVGPASAVAEVGPASAAAEVGPTSTVQSVDRALTILDILARHGELGVTELAASLGVHKSTAFRLVSVLEQHRLVESSASAASTASGSASSGWPAPPRLG